MICPNCGQERPGNGLCDSTLCRALLSIDQEDIDRERAEHAADILADLHAYLRIVGGEKQTFEE